MTLKPVENPADYPNFIITSFAFERISSTLLETIGPKKLHLFFGTRLTFDEDGSLLKAWHPRETSPLLPTDTLVYTIGSNEVLIEKPEV